MKRFPGSPLVACAVAIPLAFAAPSIGATSKVPAGAVAVVKGKITTAGSYTCNGRVAGRVLRQKPKAKGRVYFISWARLAAGTSAAARKASVPKRNALTRQAKAFRGKARAGAVACAQLAGGGGAPAQRVIFDFTGAAGLAVGGGAVANERRRAEMQTNSSLLKVMGDGSLLSAIQSGSLPQVERVVTGPDGAVHLISGLMSLTMRCGLLRVARDGGEGTCLSEGQVRNGIVGGPQSYRNDPVQFDAAGGVYFEPYAPSLGGPSSNTIVRWQGGASRTVVTTYQGAQSWLVTPRGDVFISASSPGSGSTWTRRYPAEGGLQTIDPGIASPLLRFPDENVYFTTTSGLRQYSVATSALTPLPWVSCSGTPATFDGSGYSSCTWAPTAFATTPSGKAFIANFEGRVAQLYPTFAVTTTAVQTGQVMLGVGDDLIIAGRNAGGQQVTTRIDTGTGSETMLIPGTNEIEIYRLLRSANGAKVLFDGLRFADNTYVVGEIDLGTNAVNITAGTPEKLSDFATFG
jgi:hypothetical protein